MSSKSKFVKLSEVEPKFEDVLNKKELAQVNTRKRKLPTGEAASSTRASDPLFEVEKKPATLDDSNMKLPKDVKIEEPDTGTDQPGCSNIFDEKKPQQILPGINSEALNKATTNMPAPTETKKKGITFITCQVCNQRLMNMRKSLTSHGWSHLEQKNIHRYICPVKGCSFGNSALHPVRSHLWKCHFAQRNADIADQLDEKMTDVHLNMMRVCFGAEYDMDMEIVVMNPTSLNFETSNTIQLDSNVSSALVSERQSTRFEKKLRRAAVQLEHTNEQVRERIDAILKIAALEAEEQEKDDPPPIVVKAENLEGESSEAVETCDDLQPDQNTTCLVCNKSFNISKPNCKRASEHALSHSSHLFGLRRYRCLGCQLYLNSTTFNIATHTKSRHPNMKNCLVEDMAQQWDVVTLMKLSIQCFEDASLLLRFLKREDELKADANNLYATLKLHTRNTLEFFTVSQDNYKRMYIQGHLHCRCRSKRFDNPVFSQIVLGHAFTHAKRSLKLDAFSCKYCPITASYEGEMIQHLRKMHGHSLNSHYTNNSQSWRPSVLANLSEICYDDQLLLLKLMGRKDESLDCKLNEALEEGMSNLMETRIRRSNQLNEELSTPKKIKSAERTNIEHQKFSESPQLFKSKVQSTVKEEESIE